MLVSGLQKLMALDVRGRMGYTAGCGMARCGYSRCAASKDFGGVYQRKKTLTGWATSRMRYYQSSNPQTVPQQAWRTIFSSGVVQYQALTSDEKLQLSKEARHYRMTGFNLYMRRWLQSQRA